jgi:hypothetical protein
MALLISVSKTHHKFTSLRYLQLGVKKCDYTAHHQDSTWVQERSDQSACSAQFRYRWYVLYVQSVLQSHYSYGETRDYFSSTIKKLVPVKNF